MYEEQEQRIKQQAHDQATAGSPGRNASPLQGLGKVAQASLREQVESQRYRAEASARELSRMSLLGELLDKNPEVAAILDLLGVRPNG